MVSEHFIDFKVDFSQRGAFTRHGGAYDRGSADAYYGRSPSPHLFTGDTYNSTCLEECDMSSEEIAAYYQGYHDQDDRKDYGDE